MSWFSPRRSPRKQSNDKSLPSGVKESLAPSSSSSSSSSKTDLSLSSVDDATDIENHPIVSLLTECSENDTSCCGIDPSDITTLISKLHIGTLQTDAADEAQDESTPPPDPDAKDENFLRVDEVSVSSIRASFIPGSLRMELFHDDDPLQLCVDSLKIRFGISRKFLDHLGRPRLNIVVDLPPDLCKILDEANDVAHKLSIESGTASEWRLTVMRKKGFTNYPTARLQ